MSPSFWTLTSLHRCCTIKITNRTCFQFCICPSVPAACCSLSQLWCLNWNGLVSQWFPAVLHPPIPVNKRPNLVGKPSDHGEGNSDGCTDAALNTDALCPVRCSYTHERRLRGKLDSCCFLNQSLANFYFHATPPVQQTFHASHHFVNFFFHLSNKIA